MTDEGFAVVCVLHGDPILPPWLAAPEIAARLHLVVNDPAPGTYVSLPPGAHVNDVPQGFAANVNAAFARVWSDGGPPAVVCLNFDLELAPDVPRKLVQALLAEPGLALVAPAMTNAAGEPVFSVGRWPTSLKEFTRAAGLRSGRPQRVVRALLRRSPRWRARNAAPVHSRLLTAQEYLPWTCVAVSRQAWLAVGPLDERFALYAEDMDWGRRAAAAGWQARILDVGPVVHEERATRNPQTDALYEQSHARFHDKWGRTDHVRWQRRGAALRRVWTRGKGGQGPLSG